MMFRNLKNIRICDIYIPGMGNVVNFQNLKKEFVKNISDLPLRGQNCVVLFKNANIKGKKRV